MKRSVTGALLVALAFSMIASAQARNTNAKGSKASQTAKKPPCSPNLAACPDQGCGTAFDPKLNKRKNIVKIDGTGTVKTLTSIKKLDDPENFTQGDDRDELEALGEGTKVTVTAYLLVAKKEGAESCNCGLTSPADTDNHLVLVTKSLVDQTPLTAKTADAVAAAMKVREPESITAEFTPRVRLTHPNFTRETVQALIKTTPQQALWVRVTGQLMFDSEHFIRHHLVRVNNWEIHPVLEMEYCTTGANCKVNSDAGWKSIDDPR
jgi:hypothetical protein